MSPYARKITENWEKDLEVNLWAQENTGRLQGEKRPRNRNKNQKTKILRTRGKSGPRKTKSVNTRGYVKQMREETKSLKKNWIENDMEKN